MKGLSAFLEGLAGAYGGVGRPSLEGRFVALLLTQAGPLALGEAARALGISKPALTRVALPMLERGDVKREVDPSSREHRYSLTDHAYTRDLRAHLNALREVAQQVDALLAHNASLSPEARSKLSKHAGLGRRAASALERVIAPEEAVQDAELREHLEQNWDALPPDQGGQRVKR